YCIRVHAEWQYPRRSPWKIPALLVQCLIQTSPRNPWARPRWGMADQDVSLSTRIEATKKDMRAYERTPKYEKLLDLTPNDELAPSRAFKLCVNSMPALATTIRSLSPRR